jgi:hypothetical protein
VPKRARSVSYKLVFCRYKLLEQILSNCSFDCAGGIILLKSVKNDYKKPRKFISLFIYDRESSNSFVKAALPHLFSACVYCMQLRFQSNYLGLSQPA